MKKNFYFLVTILIGLTTISCDDFNNSFLPTTYDIQGKVEKGPFINGSSITIQPMDANLQVLGNMYSTSIIDDLGNFILGSKEFPTPYAELMANGYFFNEVKGGLSNGTLTLKALVDLRNGTTTNVNILTHLKYARIKNLIASGKKFSDANTQAQTELLREFSLEAYAEKDASSFSIISGTDESAALITISSLLLMERSEAALTEYLSRLSSDFGLDGKFSDDIRTQINADKEKLAKQLTKIRENIISRYQGLGIDISVKNLYNFIDWNNDGVAGNDILQAGQSISLEKTHIEVPNEGGTYTVKINSPFPVYLEPQVEEPIESLPPSTIVPESFWGENNSLYEGYDESLFTDSKIETQIKLNDNTLEIIVSPLYSKVAQTSSLQLYDYIGNVVASISITQEGRIIEIPVHDIPKLNDMGISAVVSIFSRLADGLGYYNVIEQNYINEEHLKIVINSSSNYINRAWGNIYNSIRNLLYIKKVDEERLDVYEDYINVISSFCYSNLIYGWGDVPYVTDYDQLMEYTSYKRESAQVIFDDLKSKLSKAIENLEEKKNESLKVQEFFFASKDVARVLLANIYMYENNYSDAIPLLQKVIENSFYSLDTSTHYNTTESAMDSQEVIFALVNEAQQTRANITLRQPGVIPYMTLSDVYLSLAECHYKLNDAETATRYIDDVVKTKNLTISENDIIKQIKEVREQILLYSGTYFAFLKRTGIAEEVCGLKFYQQYMLLFPIPLDEIQFNKDMTQNPGYE